ncbi:MAG: Rieske 2Fe-2S domain-containing protein [Labilithrix sp.]|nr:Rieske 2Fe-2S domain-containing protein [Labilithrix sp.]MBX3223811.1 Rieske 2Fe-2S domain-containing protein [Labilithrix sp.]
MPSRLPPFEADLARASTLPAFAYTDAAILAAERDRIFRRTWQPIAHAADVAAPGSYVTGAVDGAPVVVTRDAGGVLRGFHNVCRHRAGPVASGKGARRSLTCKYHGWTYALDGKLVTTPELGEVKDFDRSCHGLRPVQAAVWGPIVFVNLDRDAEPLESVLGKIPDETRAFRLDAMKLVARKDYTLACNWKTYVDNFLEGYHLPTVHPGLFKELDYDAYRVETHRLYSAQIAPIRRARSEGGARHYAPTAEGELEALYYWVFPNWMLNVYPDNMSLNIVLPLGVDRTLTVFEWFRHDGATPEEIERTVRFSDGIQLEDIEICEAVQRGLASGSYEAGRFSALRENGVHHFQALVHEHLVRSR